MEGLMRRWTYFQWLILAVAFSAVAVFCFAALQQASKVPPPIPINTAGHPTVGNGDAKVQIVVFEDFRCSTCRLYSELVFPKIERKYLDSGKVRYTLVPLAFMDESKELANAALAVYSIAPDRYLAFAHELFEEFEPTVHAMLQIAKKVGGIDEARLEECLRAQCHFDAIDRSFSWAQEIMGAEFGTPSLYVNGIKTSPTNYRAIETRIDRALYLAEKEN